MQIDEQELKRRSALWEQGYWEIPDGIDTAQFNFNWRPSRYDRPYIHQFGTQWQRTGGPRFIVPDNEGVKYDDTQRVTALPRPELFVNLVDEKYDVDFDFSWHPDDTEPPFIYVWGNQFIDGREMPTIEYHVPGATDRKFVTDSIVTLKGKKFNWKTLHQLDFYGFDFNWAPHPYEPPFIYVWGNQWYSAEIDPTVEYHVPGATERKYMTDTPAYLLSTDENWRVLISNASIDFSWKPHPHDPPYIYVWGNQWHDALLEPTIEYHVPGATEKKYMTDPPAYLLPTEENWQIIIPGSTFDFSWRPHPHEPPFIYVWGNQWYSAEVEPTVEYHVPGATERKYINEPHAQVSPTEENWKIIIPGSTVDFSWRPHPHEPPFIYVWGNKWNASTVESTVEYHVPGATERKYINETVAELAIDMKPWTVPDASDLKTFDFTWRPNPLAPPQIYQWENNGPVYTVDGATEVVLMQREDRYTVSKISRYYITTTLEDLIGQHPHEVFWALNSELNYDKFDFNWKPTEENFRHINVFGTRLSKDSQTYYINAPAYFNGYRDFNYVEDHVIDIDTNIDMFYVDRGNLGSQLRFDLLKQRYPLIQKTRFLNSWVDTITRCVKKSSTGLAWILSSDVDYEDFKFDYYPSTWQRNQIHVFGNQWTHWGNTYLVNTETFVKDTEYVRVIEHLKNINHVRTKKTRLVESLHDVVYIDHGFNTAVDLETIKERCPNSEITVIEYKNSYLDTLKQWVESIPEYAKREHHWVWVCTSICDYSNFDFTWTCDPFQSQQIHVFASKIKHVRQKFGDTFLVNISEFSRYISDLCRLEDYQFKVNYVGYVTAERKPHPVIEHCHDTQVNAVKELSRTFPYYELINQDADQCETQVPSLWDNEHKTVIVETSGASRIIVPDCAIDIIDREIYDYPRIVKSNNLSPSKPLDIMFISNGEPAAEDNYQYLLKIAEQRKIPNRIIRVKDVQGRVASQMAAAQSTTTNWYFFMNGKIRINPEFDWNWQPDRLQQPKHYIFTATNPVNGLEYGHQAIVANHRGLTLNTVVTGLDFTLNSLHEVVEMNCGIAVYNTDAWTAWRTAFREAIKLRNNTDQVSRDRLKAWTSDGRGDYQEYSKQGALDGIEYYEQVKGNLELLMLSYDWAWLKEYYDSRYNI